MIMKKGVIYHITGYDPSSLKNCELINYVEPLAAVLLSHLQLAFSDS